IGNPPFGHAGEDAIRDWFWNHSVRYLRGLDLTPQQIGDLLAFEGNAQGFRILTKLQGWRARGGLQLSCATLGVFMKYPFPVDPRLADERVTGTSTHTAKFGYFQADAAAFRAVCEELGLLHLGDGRFARHPLAFLVEAADDICYSIVDIEDAFKFGLMDFGMAEDVLLRIIGRRPGRYDLLIGDGADQSDRIQYLRAKAIGELVDQTVRAYRTHYDAIMAGAFADDLLDHVESAAGVAEIRELCERHLYGSRQKVERELMGFSVVHGLLEIFVEAVHHWGLAGGDRTALAPKYRRVLDFITGLGSTLPTEPYERLLFVTDIVSGMTDSFALTTYRKLKGISYAD
ncbi:MAG TPA: dNTP triphosphohydrolase, partial [Alphaproteobacteria bacterium]|nr:dNTP triphosphohydrolase [Alphaproteobacteria bacterium]